MAEIGTVEPEGSHEVAQDAPERIPGTLRLLWLLLWRPVDLHYLLHGAGVRSPGGRIGQLWREQAEGSRAAGLYARRMLLLLLVVSPLGTGLVGAAAQSLGLPMEGGWVLSAVLCSVMGLFLALTAGLAAGTLMGMLASMAMLVGVHAVVAEAFGPKMGGVAAAIMGGCLGGVGGLCAGSIGALARGQGLSINRVQLGAIVLSLVPMLVWGSGGAWRFGGAVAASALVMFLVAAFRLPIFLAEAPVQAAAFALERWAGLRTLHWSPVNHHNLSYLPYPFLRAHMALAARSRPMEVLEVANACLKSPGNALLGWPWVLAALVQAEEASLGPRDDEPSGS
jgi:MFS family permease